MKIVGATEKPQEITLTVSFKCTKQLMNAILNYKIYEENFPELNSTARENPCMFSNRIRCEEKKFSKCSMTYGHMEILIQK
jgi:hypothetical protein